MVNWWYWREVPSSWSLGTSFQIPQPRNPTEHYTFQPICLRAAQYALVGRMQPAGRSLPTPGLRQSLCALCKKKSGFFTAQCNAEHGICYAKSVCLSIRHSRELSERIIEILSVYDRLIIPFHRQLACHGFTHNGGTEYKRNSDFSTKCSYIVLEM